MHEQSRRQFLTHSAAAGILALGGQRLLAQQAAAARPTDMTIARWAGKASPTAAEMKQIAVRLTEKAIDGLGGLKRFVSRGAVVWVKPNIGWDRLPEQAANTNPDVVATLVRLCFQAGAKVVKVGDNPCNIAAKTYERSGIAPAVRELGLGAKVVFLDPSRFRETQIGGERLKTLPLYPEVLECDLVINVPVLKHHMLSGATMCMKNYMGVIEKRNSLHQALPVCVADLTRFMKPKICVLDAMRILKDHGPVGGNLRDVEVKTTVAAGVDIVALDALGAELMGKKPADYATVVKGQEVGLGKMDYRSLNLRELAVS
jgi:uncharacterized protein (DUF362 family)